jgi:predicted dehydrogenase
MRHRAHDAPSDQIVFGGIGIGSRGQHDLSKLLNFNQARFVAVCDVRNERREAVKSMVDQKYGNHDCRMCDDQYTLLARQDIDAVLIATGDRWHTPLAILAAQHGKDVYCEKPCSMSMEESWALADAFRRYNRIYQAGCQRRNGANFELCKELLKTGALGKLHTLYANVGPAVNWPPVPSRDWLAAEELPPPGARRGSLARTCALASLQLRICAGRMAQLLRFSWRRHSRMGLAHRGPVPMGSGI